MEENKEKKEKTGFMAQGRSVIIAVIAALSAIICVSIFTGGLVDYKKRYAQGCLRHHQEGCGTGETVSGGKPGGG